MIKNIFLTLGAIIILTPAVKAEEISPAIEKTYDKTYRLKGGGSLLPTDIERASPPPEDKGLAENGHSPLSLLQKAPNNPDKGIASILKIAPSLKAKENFFVHILDDYTNSNLKGDDFSGQDLGGISFRNAKLKKVDFSETNLTGADFSNAEITESNFTDAVIKWANFTNVTFKNTELTGADFTEAITLNMDLGEANNSLNFEDAPQPPHD